MVLSLLEPRHEAGPDRAERGVLAPGEARRAAEQVIDGSAEAGIAVARWAESPIESTKSNRECFLRIDVE